MVVSQQGIDGLVGQNLNAIQQYMALLNQQENVAAVAASQQQAPQTPISANALIFNAFNRGDPQQQQLAYAAFQSSSDLTNAAFGMNERRSSAPFIGGQQIIRPQLTPANQSSPMLSPLLQVVQQQQQSSGSSSVNNDQISPMNAFANLPPNLLQANLLNELQREVQRQQQVVAQQQQLHQIQQILQQANVHPAQTHQLMAAIQQQQQSQNAAVVAAAAAAHNPMFVQNQLRQQAPRPPTQVLQPQSASLMNQSGNLNQLNGSRFFEDAVTVAKKLSQPQLPTIPPSPIPGTSNTLTQILPKRLSFSNQSNQNPKKPSITGGQQLHRPIPAPLRPPIDNPSTSDGFGISNPVVPPMHTGLPEQPYYPSHFMRGTSIKLETGELRLIEDMKPEDFKCSSLLTPDLRILIGEVTELKPTNCCRNVIVNYKLEINDEPADGSMTASAEYPFYEIENGWSSYDPTKTMNLYGLKCRQLLIGDKCIVLSKDFPEKEDEKLREKWQTQLRNQYSEFRNKLDEDSNTLRDDPMDGTTTGQSYGRLMRKSIPPPLPMFGEGQNSNLLAISQQNGPIQQRLTSESDTPLTSTISAPAEAYRMKSSFSLTTPNEPISAPAAMDDMTVEAASRRPSNMEGIPEEEGSGNSKSSTMPKTSEQSNFYLDFSI